MENKLRELFKFNRSEQRGIIILIILILLAGIIPKFIKFSKPDNNVDLQKFRKEIQDFENTQSQTTDSIHHTVDFHNITHSIAEQKLKPFYFNPNNLPAEEWKRMGLSDKQIKIIKNYEAKGGKFYTKADVKKMYCISNTEFAILEPYITIPENTKPVYTHSEVKLSKPVIAIELNSADTTTLKQLNGIGSAFAKRIVKYRDLLGGFYSINQLGEVYGLPAETVELIKNNITINTSLIKKININQAGIADIKKHPYLKKHEWAKAIIDRRIAKGNYKSVDELKEITVIPEETFVKIKPYLSIN